MENEERHTIGLSNRTLAIIVIAVALLMFVLTGFKFEAFFATLFAGFVSVLVYKTIARAEHKTGHEATEIIQRHKNPDYYYAQKEKANNIAVAEEIDIDLMQLIDTAFEDEDVEKMERKNSPYDSSFTLTWKNIIHYLIKGKQIRE